MADPISYLITANSAEARAAVAQYASELQKLKGVTVDTTAATVPAARATTALTTTTQTARKATVDYRASIGQLAQGMGALNPVIGQVAGSVMGFTALAGPAGIAIGAITTAIPFLISALRDQEEATNQAAGAQAEYNERLRVGRERVEELEQARERSVRQAFGVESAADLEAELAGLQEQPLGRAGSPEARAALAQEADLRERITQARQQEAQFAREVADADEEVENAAERAAGRGARRQTAGPGLASDDLTEIMGGGTAGDALEAELRKEGLITDNLVGELEERRRLQTEYQEFLREQEQSEIDARKAQHEKILQFQEEQLAQAIAAKEAEQAADAKRAANEEKLAADRLAMATDVTGAVIQGSEMILSALGADMGTMEIFRGISDAAQAITSFAAQNYVSGALYLVSSGLHFANAAQMGVGGGGSSATASATGAAATQPTAQQTTNQAVNIFINSPTSEEDIGRLHRRYDAAAERRFGRQAA